MKNITSNKIKQKINALQAAMAHGTEKEQQQAFDDFTGAVMEQIREDYELSHGDTQALAARGYRQLTSQERNFYEAWIENAKNASPQQAWNDIMNGGIPLTIIEDVQRNLVQEHPLLDAINFVNAGYATRWLVNNANAQTAAWGEVTAEITKEIQGSFKVIDLTQAKLSAFCMIPMDLIDMGVTFLDAYARAILTESAATALEAGVVTGTGKGMPIGLDRQVQAKVAVTEGVYPQKDKVVVKDFTPKTYGGLIARMAKTELGQYRTIPYVGLICNPVDYFNKVMPATTVLNAVGTYNGMVFPFPTEAIQSAAVAEGEAIMAVPSEYTLAMASPKTGNISFDDSVKFLEDARTYKIKLFANGRAFDNTAALRLDISGLSEAYITVKNVASA